MHDVIKNYPLPFTMGVERKRKACWEASWQTCTRWQKCTRKKTRDEQASADCLSFVMHKVTTVGIMAALLLSQYTSVMDIVTDLILLRSAANGGYILFQMTLFFCLLSPYVLCYSAGVQIFLSRKTFSKVDILSPRLILLCLYLFPTGIAYFMLLDAVNLVLGIAKLVCFGCLEKVESKEDWIVIESRVVESFGISRTDWLALKQQKTISQLLLSTMSIASAHFTHSSLL